MKFTSVLIAVGFVISFPAMAEPYAEWGVVADDLPITEYNDGARAPDASEVPIPLAPGGVIVSINSRKRQQICQVNVRTKRSVNDVCGFYNNALNTDEYRPVEIPFMPEGEPSCGFYKEGDIGGYGVRVQNNRDRAFSANGVTLVMVTYRPGRCNE